MESFGSYTMSWTQGVTISSPVILQCFFQSVNHLFSLFVLQKKPQQQQHHSKPKTPTVEQQRQQQQKAFQESHQKELDLLSILHGGKKETSSTKPLPNRSRTTSTSAAHQERSGGFDMNQFASQAGDLAISTGASNNNKPTPKVFDCAELESKLIRGDSSDMREVHSSPNLRTLSQVENTKPGALNLNVTPKGPQVNE